MKQMLLITVTYICLSVTLFGLDRLGVSAISIEPTHDGELSPQDIALVEQHDSVQAGGPGLKDEICSVDSDCQSNICAFRDSLKRKQTCVAAKQSPGAGCSDASDCIFNVCAVPNGVSTKFKYCQLPGFFVTKGMDLEECDINAACTSGLCSWQDGNKVRKRCIPTKGLASGSACALNSDCAGPITILASLRIGGICRVRSVADQTSYCSTTGALHEVCDSDADCSTGKCAAVATRAFKRCAGQSGLENGRSCAVDADCASKNCLKRGSVAFCSGDAKLSTPVLSSALIKRVLPAILCGSAAEGKTLTLRCSSNQIINTVAFASYGTPVVSGGCNNFRTGSCHAPISVQYVQAQCLQKASCTIQIGNGKKAGAFTLTDPCVGTAKKLAARITCVAKPSNLVALSDTEPLAVAAAVAAPSGGSSCSPPPIPANGVLGDCQNGLQDGDSCSIACNDGFQLQGAVYTCTGSTLSGSQSCVAAGCSVPDKPEIGSYAPAGCPVGPDGKIVSGTQCALTCDSGYHIAGAPVPPRKCNNGNLEGEQQMCEGDNCNALTDAIDHGTQGTCGVTIAARAQCSIVCQQGYHAEPADPRTCIAGALTGSAQKCAGNPCPAPTAPPANGNLGTCSRQINHGDTCTIGCDPGYKLVGDDRTCTAGLLSGSDQTCVGLPCAALSRTLENGALGTCGAEIAHGGSCTYTCDKGYQLVGDPINCKATVTSQDNMVCKGLPCAPRQTPPDNGGLGDCGAQIPHGTTCSFTCKQGYHVVGDPRTCTATVLSGTDQHCEGDPCDALKLVPINGQLGDCGKDIAHASTCQIQCDTGFHVEGDPLSCFAGQLKVQVTPVCIGNPCPALNPLPPHAKPGTCGVEILHGQSCSIECEFGWLGRGPNERQCYAGKLQGDPQRCIQDPGPDVLDKMDESIDSINKINANMHDIKIQQQVEQQKETAIMQHGLDVNAEVARKAVPLWQKAIAGYPKRGYKPIDINNQYTYDRVYMPPQTSTDETVLKAGKSLAAAADALHAQRVEAMEATCKEKTCDVTADTIKAASADNTSV